MNIPQNEPEKKRGTEKRVRSERDVVLETIFSAFEKHQYYTLKDLIGITQQPVVSFPHFPSEPFPNLWGFGDPSEHFPNHNGFFIGIWRFS